MIASYLKDKRILILIGIVMLLAVLDAYYGIHFGIDFSGGTQIPVMLERPANATIMASLISDINQRVSTFGLKQVIVEGVGNSNIYVTVPSVASSDINQTISIIKSQGRFIGIVSGHEAINGSDILKGSVGAIAPQQSGREVIWAVSFYITQQAVTKFAKAVFGQANQPLYMFLDRPTHAAIIMNISLLSNTSLGITPAKGLAITKAALAYGNETIPIITQTNSTYIINYIKANNYSKVFVESGANPNLVKALQGMNITVIQEDRENMTPQFMSLGFNNTIVNSWSMVGLLSAPVLNASITQGSVGDSFEISGMAPQSLSLQQQYTFATNQEKTISSILNGGALPMQVMVGTPTTVPPTLGKESLYVSGIAALLAIIALSLFVMARYKKPFLVVPILLTTFTELFIIVSIIGVAGSIDLSAFAGMIAVIGTGVDAQIIITDEILTGESKQSTAKIVLGKAFYIVWADAALLIIAMLPLFFSTSLVNVIGFSE
ncbi:MAG: hypothetical protein QW045_02350, partial [Candidatus Micrarchaeaceae archaeon]